MTSIQDSIAVRKMISILFTHYASLLPYFRYIQGAFIIFNSPQNNQRRIYMFYFSAQVLHQRQLSIRDYLHPKLMIIPLPQHANYLIFQQLKIVELKGVRDQICHFTHLNNQHSKDQHQVKITNCCILRIFTKKIIENNIHPMK